MTLVTNTQRSWKHSKQIKFRDCLLPFVSESFVFRLLLGNTELKYGRPCLVVVYVGIIHGLSYCEENVGWSDLKIFFCLEYLDGRKMMRSFMACILLPADRINSDEIDWACDM